MNRLLLGALITGLLAAGCAGTGPATTAPTTSSRLHPPPPAPPGGVVFQVRSDGGYVSSLVTASRVPDVTVYADGSVYLAERDLGWDAPVRIRVDHLDPAAVASFVADVEGEGIVREGDFGRPAVTDMVDTTVWLSGPGGAVSATAYALDFSAGTAPTMSGDQVRHRARLRSVIDTATRLATDPQEWTPDRVRVVNVPYGNPPTGSDPAWPGPDVAQAEAAAWGGNGCLGVADGAAALYAAARANPGSTWTTDAGPHTLAVVPVLPGEEPC